MSIFEYASGILTIVIGLGVAHLLGGLGNVIRARKRITMSMAPLIWMVGQVFMMVGWWWALWHWLSSIEELSVWLFLPFFVASVCWYLAARLSVPEISAEGDTHLWEEFSEVRFPFFSLLFVAYFVMYLFGALSGAEWGASVGDYLGYVLVALTFTGMFLKSERSNAWLAAIFISLYVLQEALQPAIQ